MDLYHALARARLKPQECRGCGASLESASLHQASTRFGAMLGELHLSDELAALLLAATDDLVVKCGQCAARNVAPGGRTADAGEH